MVSGGDAFAQLLARRRLLVCVGPGGVGKTTVAAAMGLHAARMGRKTLRVDLRDAVKSVPKSLSDYDLELSGDGTSLTYHYDTRGEGTGITRLLQALAKEGLSLRDIQTTQSSLEEIFVGLVNEEDAA